MEGIILGTASVQEGEHMNGISRLIQKVPLGNCFCQRIALPDKQYDRE